MTTPKEERERISATLETAADALRGGKAVKVFEFRVAPNDQYTTKVTWWPPRTGDPAPPSLLLGQRYKVLFDKIPTGEQSEKGTPKFYRNFVEATPDDTPAPARGASPAPGSTPHPRDQQEDPTRESIERQVAFKGAVELACARIAQGEKQGHYHIAQMTEYFAGVIRKEFTVKPIGSKDDAQDTPPPAPQGPPQAPGAQDDPGAMFNERHAPAAPGPITDVGTLFTRAMKEYPKLRNSPDVLQYLREVASRIPEFAHYANVRKPADILNPAEAYDAINAAMSAKLGTGG